MEVAGFIDYAHQHGIFSAASQCCCAVHLVEVQAMRAAVVIDEQLVGGRTVGACLAVIVIHFDDAAAGKIVDFELLKAMVTRAAASHVYSCRFIALREVNDAAASHFYFGNITVCSDIPGSTIHLEVGAFFRKAGVTEAEVCSRGGCV